MDHGVGANRAEVQRVTGIAQTPTFRAATQTQYAGGSQATEVQAATTEKKILE